MKIKSATRRRLASRSSRRQRAVYNDRCPGKRHVAGMVVAVARSKQNMEHSRFLVSVTARFQQASGALSRHRFLAARRTEALRDGHWMTRGRRTPKESSPSGRGDRSGGSRRRAVGWSLVVFGTPAEEVVDREDHVKSCSDARRASVRVNNRPRQPSSMKSPSRRRRGGFERSATKTDEGDDRPTDSNIDVRQETSADCVSH